VAVSAVAAVVVVELPEPLGQRLHCQNRMMDQLLHLAAMAELVEQRQV